MEELKLDEMLLHKVDKRVDCWACGDMWVSVVPRKRNYGRCPRCHAARDERYQKARRENPDKVINSDSSGSAWDSDEDKSSDDDLGHEESSVQKHQVKMVRKKRPLEDGEEKVELPATELLEEKEEEKPPAVETSDMEVDSVWVSSQFPAVTAALIAEIVHGDDEPLPPRYQAKVIRRVRNFGEKKRNAPRRSHQIVPEAHRVTHNAIGRAMHVHAYVPNNNLRIGATFHAPWINVEDPERIFFFEA